MNWSDQIVPASQKPCGHFQSLWRCFTLRPLMNKGETSVRTGDAIVEILKREGISTLFCFPTTPLIENAVAAGIRPIICRQERVGVDMADGFARVTNGKPPGVFLMQYGPGSENAFPGI